MRRALLILTLVWIPFHDLLAASLWSAGAAPLVLLLTPARTALVFAVAAWGFFDASLPSMVRYTTLSYVCLVVIYSLIGAVYGVPAPVIWVTSATLLLPFAFTITGFQLVRTHADLSVAAGIVALIAAISVLFGTYDRNHTEFWTTSVQLPRYLREVKGIVRGLEPTTLLPWNYFGYGGVRRAGGLLAAPLAQGSYLATALVVALGAYFRRSRVLALSLVALFAFGIYESTTRGAMIMSVLAVSYFMLNASRRGSGTVLNIAILVIGAIAVFQPLYDIVSYTIGMRDGSTAGHVVALNRNLAVLPDVLFFGRGVGSQGSIAAQQGLATIGGGEGALFTMAIQLGVPGAVIFLAFYGYLWRSLGRGAWVSEESGPLIVAAAALMIGTAATLIKSEHILTFSGMGTLWLIVGGALRLAATQRTDCAFEMGPKIAHTARL